MQFHPQRTRNKFTFHFFHCGLDMPYNNVMPYQLNTTSEYSFYRSSLRIEQYAQRASVLGYDGIAVSDENLYAYPSLAEQCRKYNLKAIFGYQISLSSSNGLSYLSNLYVLNEKGYENLCLLLSKNKKEISLEELLPLSEGLALILNTDITYFDEAFLNENSRDFLSMDKIFNDCFYFGICLSSSEEKEKAETLYRFLNERKYQSIAFPHVEYLKKEDAFQTNLLRLAKEERKDVEIEDIKKEGPYFLLSPKVLTSLYRNEDIQQADDLAKKIQFDFLQKRGQLIQFPNEDEVLKEKALKGLKEKLSVTDINEEYQSRLSYELDIIRKMHFSSYFLLVEDYVCFAHQSNIKVGPGRGSAGGSLVAFSLGITSIDPIRFHLTFERFLNPERVTMPDIDIDFEDARRNEIVLYLKQKYGEERVSDIITFVRLKPKSALNLLGPVLSVNPNHLKKLTQAVSDKASNFTQAKNDPFKGRRFLSLYNDPYDKKICDLAESLLGLPINTSIHAPGVILSEKAIYKSCPMKEGRVGTVAYEYPYMEQLGFLKVDILALSNLTFLKCIEKRITANQKMIPDILSDLENKEVYSTLNRLFLADIFQLESYGMRKTIRTLKPNSFSDLASAIALFRPGPMDYIPEFAKRKENPSLIQYKSPLLKPILEETYGIMVYQEQIMEAVKALAGFSLAEADLFRRAISKKQISKMEAYHTKFIQGCEKNSLSKDTAEDIFKDIEKFAEYGFNKSHAYSYAIITYTLLYYKTFFTEEFYLCALEQETLSSPKMDLLLKELNQKKIRLRNPNISLSGRNEYKFIKDQIYPPLNGLCQSDNLLSLIQSEREKNPFSSFYDFLFRTQSLLFEKEQKIILKMIDAGCFDDFSKSRLGMKNRLSTYLNFAHFGMDETQIPPIRDDGEDIGEMLYLEKMALGRILSCRLNQIYSMEGYQTFLISDTSLLEISHIVQIESEGMTYRLSVNEDKNYEKYDFLLVQADFSRKETYIHPERVINKKRKVVKHE